MDIGHRSAQIVLEPTAVADEHAFLIGRPPLGEYLGFVKAQF